jgi:NAD+ diphosphatase
MPMLQTPPDFVALLAPQPTPDTLTFVFRRHDLLVRSADLGLPDDAALGLVGIVEERTVPVGLLGGRYCRAAWVEPDNEAPAGCEFSGLRRLFGAVDERLVAVAGRAYQLAEWARTHRYCGACGASTEGMAGERCFRCPACGHMAYPRISPAMMTLVRRGDSILLARHARLPTTRYTALAGFLEAGESIEDAVHREVFEEVGLRVRSLRYFGSQSWPFPHSLMIAFTAEYDSGEVRVDEREITDARWFGPGDALPDIPPGISIASALIRANLP